jgi:cell division protein FtsB
VTDTDAIRAQLAADLHDARQEVDRLRGENDRLRREVGSLIRERAGLRERKRWALP